MRQIWMILLLAATASAADLTIIMDGHYIVPAGELYVARDQATRMLASIGVQTVWAKKSDGQDRTIHVTFTTHVAGRPGAMAFTNPFDPAPVVTVMYDRVLAATAGQAKLRLTVLAHVLVHEIGHVLLRHNRHTEDGIMKARWSSTDYVRMLYRPLTFLPEDAAMIRLGLATVRIAAAR